MQDSLFRAFRDLAYAEAGIRLGDGKEALVEARVGKRLRALGLRSERDYLALLEGDDSGGELVHFLDAISTNYTSFLREPDHFTRLAELAGAGLRAGGRRFRFWSAACSSGEEPYSMALTLADAFGRAPVDWRILATDLSTKVLHRAAAGVYSERQLLPLTRAKRLSGFEEAGAEPREGALFAVKAELRARVCFLRLNLAQPPFPMNGPLDAIFCRNVMIYLDAAVRQALVGELERLLAPGGLLFIGHAETLTGLRSGLRMVVPSVFRKAEG